METDIKKKYIYSLLYIIWQLIKFCYERNGLGDGTSGGGKVEVVGPLNADGAIGWVVNGGCGVKPNGFAMPKIIL